LRCLALTDPGASHAILVLGELGLFRLALPEPSWPRSDGTWPLGSPRAPRSSRSSSARSPSRSTVRHRTTVNGHANSPTRRMCRSSPRRWARERACSSRTTSDTSVRVRECVSCARGRSSRRPARGWVRSERETIARRDRVTSMTALRSHRTGALISLPSSDSCKRSTDLRDGIPAVGGAGRPVPVTAHTLLNSEPLPPEAGA
jgi:hypothetical protein